MRALHVITGLASGGAESQLAQLVRRSRHDHVVTALYNVGIVGDEIRARGTPVHDVGMRSNRDLAAIGRLVRMMRAGRFDIVHVHLYRACIYGRTAAALARVPRVVTTEHSLGATLIEGRPLTRGVRRLYLATDRFSDRTIAVSDVVRTRLVAWGIPSPKIAVIPNGVDLDAFGFDPDARRAARAEFGLETGDVVIGTVGRLVPSKGHDRVLHAARPALTEGRATLLVVGDGPGRAALEDLGRRLGVAPRVRMAGERADVARLLSAMDVFVSASVPGEETFGISVLEALAAGLPVVSTYCPALDGLRSDRFHAVDDDAGLARRLADLIAAPSARRRPDALLAPFAIERVVARIDDTYDEVSRGETISRTVRAMIRMSSHRDQCST